MDRAIETASLMLGSDRSRGYCLEMICADFLAGANLESDDAGTLLQSAVRFFQFLPSEEKKSVLGLRSSGCMTNLIRLQEPTIGRSLVIGCPQSRLVKGRLPYPGMLSFG